MRQVAEYRIYADHRWQKAYFDAKQRIVPDYDVGDIVEIPLAPEATEQSKKLTAKYHGPFEIVAGLSNDRYEVQDERETKTRGRRPVVAVDQIKNWILFDATEE